MISLSETILNLNFQDRHKVFLRECKTLNYSQQANRWRAAASKTHRGEDQGSGSQRCPRIKDTLLYTQGTSCQTLHRKVRSKCVRSFYFLTKIRNAFTRLFRRKNKKLNWILDFHDERRLWRWFQSLKVELTTLDIKSDVYFVFRTRSSFKVQTSRPLKLLKSTSCLHLASLQHNKAVRKTISTHDIEF